MKSKSVTIQMKAVEQRVLSCGAVCYMLYKGTLTFQSVDEIQKLQPKCDHSNETYCNE